MPQMSPINWSIMFIFTITSFMILNWLNYYAFLYLPPESKKYEI